MIELIHLQNKNKTYSIVVKSFNPSTVAVIEPLSKDYAKSVFNIAMADPLFVKEVPFHDLYQEFCCHRSRCELTALHLTSGFTYYVLGSYTLIKDRFNEKLCMA